MRAIPTTAALAALVLCCGGRDDLDGNRRRPPGLGQEGEELSLPLDGQRVAMDLYDNRAVAELVTGGGLEIECGSVRFAAYTEGGYRSPWVMGRGAKGEPAALVDGLAGELYVPVNGDQGGLVRDKDGSLPIYLDVASAADNQLVSIFLNEHKLADLPMPTQARKSYRVTAPASAVVTGENKLRFYFRHAGELGGTRTAAAFYRIHVGGKAPADGAALVADVAVHGDKRLAALHVSRAGRLSYYLTLPAGHPALQAALAGAGAAAIRITTGDRGDHAAELWSGTAADAWKLIQVDLSDYAGDVVRLDFTGAGATDWGRPRLLLPAAPAAPPPAGDPAVDHVIVWVVSALRDDRVGGGDLSTPAFDRLAARGIRYHAVSAAPEPAAAHVALLTGTHPTGGRLAPEAVTLGERFHEAGFSTALISGNGFVNDEAGFAQGFDVYENPMRRRQPFSARVLWQRARRLLQARGKERSFVYLATVEPHLPYTPSSESLAEEWPPSDPTPDISPAGTASLARAVASGARRLTGEERRYIRALYNAEVRDADAALGEAMSDLERMELTDSTAIILVGDHGEEMFERGGFGHGEQLHDEVLRVPLIVVRPGHKGAITVARPVPLVNVYATALDLAGIAVNPEAQGRSVLAPWPPGGAPRPLFSELPGRAVSLISGTHKIIVPTHGHPELYDLAKDPGEETDLMGQRPLVERYLRTVLGLSVAFRQVWSPARWGSPANTRAAFAADHGL